MGVSCGVDITEIERIKRSFEINGKAFSDRVFTQNEIEYCENKNKVKYESYTARFAAKEAVSKALGTGISNGISWTDIEILNNSDGKPYIILHGKAKELYEGMNGNSISVSLSHCKIYAVAYVVISSEN